MTDILKIALDNRAKLHEEAAKLNEFIRYGELLLAKARDAESNVAPMPPRAASGEAAQPMDESSTDIPRPDLVRRGA